MGSQRRIFAILLIFLSLALFGACQSSSNTSGTEATDETDTTGEDTGTEGETEAVSAVEAANPDVDFDNIPIGTSVFLNSADPRGTSSSSSLQSNHIDTLEEFCDCVWNVSTGLVASYENQTSCASHFTANREGAGDIINIVDCGDAGEGVFLQPFTVRPPPGPSESIHITVTGGSACSEGLYAVHFDDFGINDRSDDEINPNNMIQKKFSCSDDDCTADLVVGTDRGDLTIYVYCDTSQGTGEYDINAESDFTLAPYTNTAEFNACSRQMTTPPTDYYYVDTPSTPQTYRIKSVFYYDEASKPTYFAIEFPALIATGPPLEEPGDTFTVLMANADGEDVEIPFTDLESLDFDSEDDHPPVYGGTRRPWCNCILGEWMQFASSGPNSTISFYFGVLTPSFAAYPYYVGYFTDTARNVDGTESSCVLP